MTSWPVTQAKLLGSLPICWLIDWLTAYKLRSPRFFFGQFLWSCLVKDCSCLDLVECWRWQCFLFHSQTWEISLVFVAIFIDFMFLFLYPFLLFYFIGLLVIYFLSIDYISGILSSACVCVFRSSGGVGASVRSGARTTSIYITSALVRRWRLFAPIWWQPSLFLFFSLFVCFLCVFIVLRPLFFPLFDRPSVCL